MGIMSMIEDEHYEEVKRLEKSINLLKRNCKRLDKDCTRLKGENNFLKEKVKSYRDRVDRDHSYALNMGDG